MDLTDLITEGEGYRQEFKENLAKLDRALAAFANGNGGIIYIGIADNGRIVKTHLTNKLRAQITNIARECDPSIRVVMKQHGPIVSITVPEGEDKPYACKEGFFLRTGATSQKLSRQEILEFIVRVNRIQFDRLFPSSLNWRRDVSKRAIHVFVAAAKLETVLADLGEEQLLLSLGVAQKQGGRLLLNHAGVLFFTESPQQWLPQVVMNYSRYQGTDKSTVIQRKIYTGTILSEATALLRDLQQDLPIGYTFDTTLQRQERPHYPPLVLREALINAVMHRDYFESGGDLAVDYYSDRIEISNPGELLSILSLETLGTRSLRRNPLIADLLHRCGWVEKLGSGIQRMRSLMHEWQLKPPHFTSQDGFFSVTLFGPKGMVEMSGLTQLPERERTFLAERNQIDEPFPSRTYQARFGVTLRTAQKDLTRLVEAGFLLREGRGKNARYRFRSGVA